MVFVTGTYNLQQTTFFPVSWEDGATVTGAGAGVMIGAGFWVVKAGTAGSKTDTSSSSEVFCPLSTTLETSWTDPPEEHFALAGQSQVSSAVFQCKPLAHSNWTNSPLTHCLYFEQSDEPW